MYISDIFFTFGMYFILQHTVNISRTISYLLSILITSCLVNFGKGSLNVSWPWGHGTCMLWYKTNVLMMHATDTKGSINLKYKFIKSIFVRLLINYFRGA